ncbi:sodium/hydrogen exchanger [Actinoplanes sp. SE50]|nr:Vacuolar cation/proton exchanger 5 [Actinoplanes sp. SE50/110]ATO82552.1 sodium/hydrogen exchanger [Actinoplanes sp. SE50]SLL99959.1 calcium/proton exchanger [Actinoplanes sp. SE50/110]
MLGAGVVAVAAAGVLHYSGATAVLAFVVAGVAVALLASLVGRSVEQLGDRFGPGATGVLQSALGNLPELFIGFFALQAGLLAVVQAAIIGSILSNILLVLGLAFVVGGVKHGTQRFDSDRARTSTVLMVLATAALVMPSLAQYVHAPAAGHEKALSLVVSVVLLGVFLLSLPSALKRSPVAEPSAPQPAEHAGPHWPLWLALTMLTGSSVAAALVSDWFVAALEPAITSLGVSQAFAGLVIVAIAGNAIENVIGIQLAYRNQADFAMAVIIQSPLQVALVLAPALVLLSLFTATTLTLVFAPLLVMAVAVAVLATAFIVFDGESNWLEGATLIALYAIIATTFWWG